MSDDSEHTHELVGIGSLLFVLIILFTLCAAQLISVFRLHFLNESTISIILGVVIGLIISLAVEGDGASLFSFDAEFFFFVLLPPIVFEAGFSLKRKHFFQNMCSILMFAVLGTMVSALVIAYGLFLASWTGLLPLFNGGDPLECLLFGALISAVDPVGTLSVLGRKELNVDPTLYSLIFGESVLNDAVSIVIFKILRSMVGTEVVISFESHFLMVLGRFCVIFVASFLIGLAVALAASFILRVLHKSSCHGHAAAAAMCLDHHCHDSDAPVVDDANPVIGDVELSAIGKAKGEELLPDDTTTDDTGDTGDSREALTKSLHTASNSLAFNRTVDGIKDIIYLDEYRHNESQILGENPSMEFSIIILLSYLAYIVGEVSSASGIVAVFSCGICMSHYAWYNLSWIAQISLHHIIRGLSKCSENFVYCYLGISMVHQYHWSALLIVFTLALCIVSRAANIFPLSALVNVRRSNKISFKMQIMIFFSSLRGAIAFALALNINTKHSDLIITTTLSIVIITTVFCGCSTKFMLDKLGLVSDSEENRRSRSPRGNLDGDSVESYRQMRSGRRTSDYYGIGKHWIRFDRDYMQKWFGGVTRPLIQHSEIGIYSNRQQVSALRG